jgi:hypothetical protein
MGLFSSSTFFFVKSAIAIRLPNPTSVILSCRRSSNFSCTYLLGTVYVADGRSGHPNPTTLTCIFIGDFRFQRNPLSRYFSQGPNNLIPNQTINLRCEFCLQREVQIHRCVSVDSIELHSCFDKKACCHHGR